MNIFMRTSEFDVWLKSLQDITAKARVLSRIRSAEAGNFGDFESEGRCRGELVQIDWRVIA